MRDSRGEDLELAGKVARSLQFAPHLVELADRVLHDVTDGGRRAFNGLHLRLESDTAPWIEAMGGAKVCLPSRNEFQTPGHTSGAQCMSLGHATRTTGVVRKFY